MNNYITHTDSPYDYYLSILKDSIKSMLGEENPDKCKAAFNQRYKEFETKECSMLPPASIAPNDPTRITRLAGYIANYVFMDVLCTTLTDYSGNFAAAPAFGVEYYTYDFHGEYTSGKKPYYKNEIDGFYINAYNTLRNNIENGIIRKNLTKPGSDGRYAVIDFEALKQNLQREIRQYYYRNPDLKTSKSPDPDLQKIFAKILGDLTKDLSASKTQYRPYGY